MIVATYKPCTKPATHCRPAGTYTKKA